MLEVDASKLTASHRDLSTDDIGAVTTSTAPYSGSVSSSSSTGLVACTQTAQYVIASLLFTQRLYFSRGSRSYQSLFAA